MTNINSKDVQNDPNYDPLSDPNSDLYDGGMTLDDSSGAYENDLGEGQASAGPTTPNEMRSYLRDLLNNNQISQADYDKYLGKVNQAVSLSPDKEAQVLSQIYSELTPGQGGDRFSADSVTTKQITDLMNEIKSGQVKPQDEQFTSEQCVTVLKQALQDERSNNSTRAAEEFKQILDAVGGADAIDPKNLAAEKLGGTPSSIDSDGTVHFDGHGDSGSDFSLHAPGDHSKVVIDNATSVTLAPKNAEDEVTLSEEGNYYVVQMGNDTFKVNKDAKLNILSDHVSGSVANDDKNITTGASEATSKTYIDPAKVADIAGKISAGAQDIGEGKSYNLHSTSTTTSYNPSTGQYETTTTSSERKSENDAAAEILNDMSAAMSETDPKKKAEAWQKVTDEVTRLSSQGMDGGHVNDITQLVFDVLYDKLGEDGFKDALKQGLIPSTFATALAAQLIINPSENTTNDWTNAGGGGPQWTHQTSSDFLVEYSGTTPTTTTAATH